MEVAVGGNSGSIGTNGIAGNGGMVMITTGTGTLFTPKGIIGVQGGDGGMWQARTGNGGNTASGQAGNSGDIGAGSVPGDAGLISLTSSTPPPGDTSTAAASEI